MKKLKEISAKEVTILLVFVVWMVGMITAVLKTINGDLL
jgi:hypothetical protein